jgi:hypothetical protein
MNPQFRSWFSQGKIAEALSGMGEYFVEDVTYRDTHDFVLAVGELLDFAHDGNEKEAATGFETALENLFQTGALKSGLLLMRAYQLITEEEGFELPLNTELVTALIGRALCRALVRSFLKMKSSEIWLVV